jgi:hypothetical protein
MDVTILDFETYYDKDYSLRRMTPVEYVLDPRFEAIGCAVREGHPSNTPTFWVDGPDLPKYFQQADRNGYYLSHNWLFDGCVLAWKYDFVPRMMGCTMSISRAVLGHVLRSVSLDSVSKYLCLPDKGDTVKNVIGMSLAAIKAGGLYDAYVDYSKRDADNANEIFNRLVRTGMFPVEELAVLDMVLRAAIKPRFRLDLHALAEHKNNVIQIKDALLARTGLVNRDALMSNDQFAALLSDMGVDPPTKISPITSKVTWAFSKTDQAFIDLEEHDDPAVQALVAARMGVKSTLEETRTERLIKISQCMWPSGKQERFLPVPLRFSGAHTHRLSGDWKLNLQNLPTRGGANAIRRALVAAPGEKIVTVDAAQIEARIVAWVCGQEDLLAQFAAGEDVYSLFASEVFGYPVDRKRKDGDHVAHGFIGKTAVLGLGYGVGWEKFQRTVSLGSKANTGKQIDLSDEEALKVVNTYRRKNDKVKESWGALNSVGIPVLARGGDFTFGPCVFEKGAINLPNGLKLKYHNLESIDDNWRYTYGGKPKRLYGAALLENIVQALARIITMLAAIRIQRAVHDSDIWLNLQAHDELVYLAQDEQVPALRTLIEYEMSQPPAWAEGLPLKAESGEGLSYGDAK